MAKFYGKIGFSISKETEKGIWDHDIIEKPYYGDIIKNNNRFSSTDKINDDVTLSNNISIIFDPYISDNYQNIKYVEFSGNKWKVTNIEIQFPRIILTLGGVYNNEE